MIANHREHLIAERYEKQGYKWLKKGWPDFLFYKEGNGEIIFVEVKVKSKRRRGPRQLRGKQAEMKAILEQFAEYRIEEL